MYSSQQKPPEVPLEPNDAADERTIEWLKRDLERRRAERAERSELVGSN